MVDLVVDFGDGPVELPSEPLYNADPNAARDVHFVVSVTYDHEVIEIYGPYYIEDSAHDKRADLDGDETVDGYYTITVHPDRSITIV